jgi:hypothetical protein
MHNNISIIMHVHSVCPVVLRIYCPLVLALFDVMRDNFIQYILTHVTGADSSR